MKFKKLFEIVLDTKLSLKTFRDELIEKKNLIENILEKTNRGMKEYKRNTEKFLEYEKTHNEYLKVQKLIDDKIDEIANFNIESPCKSCLNSHFTTSSCNLKSPCEKYPIWEEKVRIFLDSNKKFLKDYSIKVLEIALSHIGFSGVNRYYK